MMSQELMDSLRALDPVDQARPVRVPGDPERISLGESGRLGYVTYTPNHITSYRKLAQDLGVQPMKSFRK